MRLPWPFGRSTSGGPSSAPGGDGAGATSAEAADAGADLPIPPTGAWRSLPPIQRSSGPPPVVAPAAPFLAAVPGHAALPPIVTPLGHDTSPSAPAGIVVAHPHAVPSLTSSAPLPTRPVQRHASAASGVPGAPAIDEQSEPGPVVARSVDAVAAAPEPSPAAVSLRDLPPIRSVAPVAPAATVTPPSRPLTRAAMVLTPAAVAQRSTPAPAGVQRTSAPANLALPLQAGRRVPSPSAPTSTTATDGARAAAAPLRRFAELPLDRPAAPAQAPAETSAAPRRSGLGAPIVAAPASAVAQRLPIRPRRPPTLPGPHAEAAPSDPAAVAGAPSAATDEAPAAARLPVLPVARARSADAPAMPTPAASTTSPVAARPTRPAPARATVARSSVVPTLGVRPLRPSVTPASTIAPAAPSDGGSAATDLATPAPVAARWDAGASLPDTVTSLPAAHPQREVVPLQLSPSPAAPSTGASPVGPREIVFPAPDDAPGLASTFVTPAPTPTMVGRPSPAARPAQPLTLARPVAPAASQAPAPVAQPSSSAPTIARIVADPSSPGAPPVVQTTPGTGIPVATFTATPVVQREESPAPAPQGAGGHSERELDELAKQLFGRIRMQLTSEVIHEREAKGLGFDAF